MIRIQKIVVPIDFSEASKRAANYALSFALEFQSRLVLTHIAPYDAHAYEQAKLDLLALIPPARRDDLSFEVIVKSGNVHSELLGIIETEEPGLVVMGTRGRSYVERMVLGSVTDRLLRKLHVPILTVSHLDPEKELHEPGPVPLRRMLYATDLTEGSEEGLEFAIRLARGLDATLLAAHAVRFADVAFHGVESAALAPDYSNEIRARAEERLNRMVGLVSDGSIPIVTRVVEGVPYEAIDKLAAEFGADLIIINLQTKGLLERAVLGTTAERVIRTAAVPVLSLPLPAIYKSRWAAA